MSVSITEAVTRRSYHQKSFGFNTATSSFNPTIGADNFDTTTVSSLLLEVLSKEALHNTPAAVTFPWIDPLHLDPLNLRELLEARLSPDELVEEFGRRVPTPFGGLLADEYSQPAGVREGYLLGQHHAMVIRQGRKYFPDSSFEIVQLLHDCGKNAALRMTGNTAAQHVYTLQLIDHLHNTNLLPMGDQAIAWMRALIDGDPIGNYFTGRINEKQAATEVARMAQAAQAPLSEFWPFLVRFYQTDASSYTADAGGKPSLERKVFVVKPEGDLLFNLEFGRLAFSNRNEPKFLTLQERIFDGDHLYSKLPPPTITPFDRIAETPNFFLSESLRTLPAESISEDHLRNELQQLEGAMHSVLHRITLPVQQSAGVTSIVRYLPYLSEQIRTAVADVRLLIPGDMVQSVLGFVYSEVYRGEQNGIPAKETLLRLTSDVEDISGARVCPLGSDWSLWVDEPSLTLKKVKETANRAMAMCDSGEELPVVFRGCGVNNYKHQLELLERRGGPELNRLAFDVDQGILVEPQGSTSIIRNLLLGRYDYRPISTRLPSMNRATTVASAIRPSLELPHLEMNEPTALINDLDWLYQAVTSDHDLAETVADHLRNSAARGRLTSAHNRFYRVNDDSALDGQWAQVATHIRDISGHLTLPEFLGEFCIGPERRAAFNRLAEFVDGPFDVDQFLASSNDILNFYSKNGWVFHGTNDEGGFSFDRNGPYASNKHQGVAKKGSGMYLTSRPEKALQYLENKQVGSFLPIRIRLDTSPVVLDRQALFHPAIQKLAKKCADERKDLHQTLAEEYGVDLIMAGTSLLLNTAAVEFPKVDAIVKALKDAVEDTSLPEYARKTADKALGRHVYLASLERSKDA